MLYAHETKMEGEIVRRRVVRTETDLKVKLAPVFKAPDLISQRDD